MIVETLSCAGGEEVLELRHRALRPEQTSPRPPLVTHDVSITPPAAPATWTTHTRHWTISIMNSAQQVSNLVSSHYDTRVSSTVLHQSNTVDLGQSLVHHARSSNISEPCRALPASSSTGAAHVQTSEGHHQVEDWEPGLSAVEILSHLVQR